MITFEHLIIEGFGSLIKNTYFILSQEGLNIMRGRVGTGKTSIPSSLYWIIYGLPLKKGSTIETWEEIRPDDYQGVYGNLQFMKGKKQYNIIRCLSYKCKVYDGKKGGSRLIFLENGKDISVKGKTATQELINKILGYSPDLFINSVIFGQRLKRIIEETGPNKKKLFDEAFETLFIDKAKKEAIIKGKELSDLYKINTNKLESHQSTLSDLKDTLETLVETEQSFDHDKAEKMLTIKRQLLKVSEKKDKIECKIGRTKITDTTELKDKLKTIRKKLGAYENDIEEYNSLQKQIDKKSEEIKTLIEKKKSIQEDICPDCGSTLSISKKTNLKNKYKKEILSIQESIQNIHERKRQIKIDKAKHGIIALQKEEKELETLLSNVKSNRELKETLQTTFNEYSDTISELKGDFLKIQKKKIEIKSPKYKKKILKTEKRIKRLTRINKKLQKNVDLYNWLVKEPLSNSGIKAYIFNTLLNKVNERLKNYSEILGFNIEFGIDMETSARDFYQMIFKDNIIIPYNDLSGGQRQLVDTSVALAIHDVIASVRPVNILFLDEPFEGLDTETIELVSDIISYKSQNQCLFLITHHSSFNPTNSNTIYFTQNEEGATEIN